MTENEISQRIRQAQSAQEQGHLVAAQQMYDRILDRNPDHAVARFCLGMLHDRRGDRPAAELAMQHAIRLAPTNGVFQLNFAAALLAWGEVDRAVSQAESAWRLMPNSSEAAHNLGACLFAAGRFEEAELAARNEVALALHSWQAHLNLAATLTRLSRDQEARESFEAVVRLNPGHGEARMALAKIYLEQSRPIEAMEHTSAAIQSRPTDPSAHLLHGAALNDNHDYAAAAKSFERCVELDPSQWQGFTRLANVYKSLGRWTDVLQAYAAAHRLNPAQTQSFDGMIFTLRKLRAEDQALQMIEEGLKFDVTRAAALAAKAEIFRDRGALDAAVATARQALLLEPSQLKANVILACAIWDQGDYASAINLLQTALKAHPTDPATRLNLGMLRLTQGDADGWADYEARRATPGVTRASPVGSSAITWDGSSLAGKSLLIFQEQGIGDFLQCIRALPQLAAQARQVIVFTHAAMAPVVWRSPNVIVATQPNQIPPVDVQVGDMSLPFILKWSPLNPPWVDGYLAPPSEQLLVIWQEKLSFVKGFRIGIAWSGSPAHLQHQRRVIPLQLLAPLAKLQGISLVSLQVGPGASDISQVDFSVFDPTPHIKNLADTAAIMQHLDLVITVDTAVAHLAGAMGVAVWIMLPFVSDFRWLLDRDTSPWYPSMQLFRQKQIGEWESVIEEIVKAVGLKTG